MSINNPKAYHDYFVLDKLECGIQLWGNEVKSIREGSCNIKDAWCSIQNNELVLRGMHVKAWHTSNAFDIDGNRERKLLVHKSEIRRLLAKVKQDGVTLIPLSLYFSKGKCKVELGVCKGKKNYDKRETLKARQVNRDIERAVKNN